MFAQKIEFSGTGQKYSEQTKREPLKIARIEKIHESRDNAQRVVTLTYHNVSKNKDGKWIGTPVRVDRSVNDLIIVDDALSESMLNPNIQKGEVRNCNEETEDDKTEAEENKSIVSQEDDDGNNETIRVELSNDKNERNEKEDIVNQNVRRSNRTRKQRINIHPDEIGVYNFTDCALENWIDSV